MTRVGTTHVDCFASVNPQFAALTYADRVTGIHFVNVVFRVNCTISTHLLVSHSVQELRIALAFTGLQA
jgi:hypothetical protein